MISLALLAGCASDQDASSATPYEIVKAAGFSGYFRDHCPPFYDAFAQNEWTLASDIGVPSGLTVRYLFGDTVKPDLVLNSFEATAVRRIGPDGIRVRLRSAAGDVGRLEMRRSGDAYEIVAFQMPGVDIAALPIAASYERCREESSIIHLGRTPARRVTDTPFEVRLPAGYYMENHSTTARSNVMDNSASVYTVRSDAGASVLEFIGRTGTGEPGPGDWLPYARIADPPQDILQAVDCSRGIPTRRRLWFPGGAMGFPDAVLASTRGADMAVVESVIASLTLPEQPITERRPFESCGRD